MAVDVVLKIDKTSYIKCLIELRELTSETERANQAMKEFSSTLESIKKRYHPFVWWILSAIGRRNRPN